MNNTKISVELVIPSFNRLDILHATLENIRKIYPRLSICIGLQGQYPDNTFQRFIDEDSHIRVEKMPYPSTANTLNHCIITSNAEIVLILDDDAVPCFDWLESHLGAFNQISTLAYTSGREVRATKERNLFSELSRIFTELISGLFLSQDKKINGRIVGWINRMGFIFGNMDQPGNCKINSPRGCNMAVRRNFFLEIGGFNTDFKGNAWGFEADFGLRMEREGYLGMYIGSAIVIHYEISSGGSRQAGKRQWLSDFWWNHKILIKNLGPLAWIGSIPRLIKKSIF